MAGHALERLHRCRALGVAAEDADEDSRGPEIARHLHRGDGDHSDESGVLGTVAKERCDILADRFSNAICAAIGRSHTSFVSSQRAPNSPDASYDAAAPASVRAT